MRKPNQIIAYEIFKNNIQDFKQHKEYAKLDRSNQIVVCKIVSNIIRQEYY